MSQGATHTNTHSHILIDSLIGKDCRLKVDQCDRYKGVDSVICVR